MTTTQVLIREIAADAAESCVSIADDLAYSPQDALNVLSHARAYLNDIERLIVRQMRDDGWTWQEIADEYGITRQAAHERFHGAI
jgi:hypothetical protein